MTNNDEHYPQDELAQEFEREDSLYPAIRTAHEKMSVGDKRDRYIEMAHADSSRRFVFWSTDRSELPVENHVRFTLTPERKPAIADITRLVVRIPMVEDIIAPGLGAPRQGTKGLLPTYDVAIEAFNLKGESIKMLLNPEGLKTYNSVEDLDTTDEGTFVFNGQHLTVLPSTSQYLTQAEFESEWFEFRELKLMLEEYDPVHQENAGSPASNVA